MYVFKFVTMIIFLKVTTEFMPVAPPKFHKLDMIFN